MGGNGEGVGDERLIRGGEQHLRKDGEGRMDKQRERGETNIR